MKALLISGSLVISCLSIAACSDSAWSEGDKGESGGDGDSDGDSDADGDGDVDSNETSDRSTTDPEDTSDNDFVRTNCPVNQGTHECVVNTSDCRALDGTVDDAYRCASGTCCRLPTVAPSDADADGDADVACIYTCVADRRTCNNMEGTLVPSQVCDNNERCCDVGGTTDGDADTDTEDAPDSGVGDGGDDPDGGAGESCSFTCMTAVACLMEEGESLGSLDCPENEICCTAGEMPTDGCAGTCVESAVSCVIDLGGTRDPEGVCENNQVCCITGESTGTDTGGNDTETPSDTEIQDTDLREVCPVSSSATSLIQCITDASCTEQDGVADLDYKCPENNQICCVIPVLPDCPSEMSCVSPSACDGPGFQIEEGYACNGSNQVCCNDIRQPCPDELERVACTAQETCDDFGFDVDLAYLCPDQGDICCVDR